MCLKEQKDAKERIKKGTKGHKIQFRGANRLVPCTELIRLSD